MISFSNYFTIEISSYICFLVILTSDSIRLMELFLLHRGIFLSTEDLLTKVWGYDTDSDIGIVWVYISYLRKKLASLGADVSIVAKRGVGYKLEEIR